MRRRPQEEQTAENTRATTRNVKYFPSFLSFPFKPLFGSKDKRMANILVFVIIKLEISQCSARRQFLGHSSSLFDIFDDNGENLTCFENSFLAKFWSLYFPIVMYSYVCISVFFFFFRLGSLPIIYNIILHWMLNYYNLNFNLNFIILIINFH